MMIKVLTMQEKQTPNCNILESTFIELVHVPLVRSLSCAALPLAHIEVSLESRRNIGLPRGPVVTFSEPG